MTRDPFDEMDPRDGFRIERVELDGEVSLHAKTLQGGLVFAMVDAPPEDATVEVDSFREEFAGAADRLQLVLEAACRYFNTGGSWAELEAALSKFRRVAVGGLVFPGYRLHESYFNSEGGFESVFVRPDGSGEAVLWADESFVDRTTLEVLERDRDQEEPGPGEGAAAGDEGPVGEADQRQPPGRLGIEGPG